MQKINKQTGKSFIRDETVLYGFVSELPKPTKKAERELYVILADMPGFFSIYRDPNNKKNVIWLYESRPEMRNAKNAARREHLRVSSGALKFLTYKNGTEIMLIDNKK